MLYTFIRVLRELRLTCHDTKMHKTRPRLQLLLGHSKIERSVRELGLEVDDATERTSDTRRDTGASACPTATPEAPLMPSEDLPVRLQGSGTGRASTSLRGCHVAICASRARA